MIHTEVSPRFGMQKSQFAAQRLQYLEAHSPLVLHQQLLSETKDKGVSREGLMMLDQAGDFAEKVFDKAYKGKPLRQEEVPVHPVTHSQRVALRLVRSGQIPADQLAEIAAVAVLHDTVEDTNATDVDIQRKFGSKVAKGVRWVTKEDGITPERYFGKLSGAPLPVRLLKVADRIENMEVLLRMSQVSALILPDEKNNLYHLPSNRTVLESLKHNYDETIDFVVPLAADNPYFKAELARVLQQSEAALRQHTPPPTRRDSFVA